MRAHGRHIGPFANLTTHTFGVDISDQIEVVALIPVEAKVNAVVEKTEVNTNVKFVFLFVCQLGIGKRAELQSLFVSFSILTPRAGRIINSHGVAHVSGTGISGERVAGTQFRSGEHRVFKPAFGVGIPCAGHVPRREPAACGSATELVGAFIAIGTVDHIAVVVHERSGADICHRTCISAGVGIIHTVFLAHLLEQLPVGERKIAVLIAYTPSLEFFSETVKFGRFVGKHSIHLIFAGECFIICGRCTHVELLHGAGGVVEDTTGREHRHRERVGIIGIGVEIGVGRAYGGILRRDTGAISLSLVGVVHHIVILIGGYVTD